MLYCKMFPEFYKDKDKAVRDKWPLVAPQLEGHLFESIKQRDPFTCLMIMTYVWKTVPSRSTSLYAASLIKSVMMNAARQ